MESAIIEFSLHGYHRTSIDAIVKRAQVSKGAVFYHFENKGNLFLVCLNDCLDRFEKIQEENGLWEEKELFNRLLLQTKIKVAFMMKHKEISKFFIVASATDLSEETKAIRDRVDSYREQVIKRLIEDADHSYIRAGMDPQAAFDFAWTAVDAYSNKLIHRYDNWETMLDDADAIIAEFAKFVEFIKYGIYQQ